MRIKLRPSAAKDRAVLLAMLALLAASVVVSAVLIWRDSGSAPEWPMDQYFIDAADVAIRKVGGRWSFHYPNLQYSGGIASSLIAGVYKLMIPTTKATLNWHLRILAMLMYLGSAWWLARSLISSAMGQLLAYLLVCVSGLQFTQPCSELFAGAFFSLFLVALRLSWPAWLSGLLLALFSLCKVELILAVVVVSLTWGCYQLRTGAPRPWDLSLWSLGWLALFLFPAFVVEGANPIGGNRSLQAFLNSYVAFFGSHQFSGKQLSVTPDAMDTVHRAVFPRARSFLDIVRIYPRLYFDSLGVSVSRSLPMVVGAIKLMLIPLLLVVIRNHKLVSTRPYLLVLIAAVVATIVPAQIVASVRVRYLVKLLPAIMVVSMAGCLELGGFRVQWRSMLWICALVSVTWQASAFQEMWMHSTSQ